MNLVTPTSIAKTTSRIGTGNPLLVVRRMIAVASQRRALRNLDPDQLADVGITPQAALQEARKPVWDIPEYWKN